MLILGCGSLFVVVIRRCMVVGTLSIRMVASEGLTDTEVGREEECEYCYNSACREKHFVPERFAKHD